MGQGRGDGVLHETFSLLDGLAKREGVSEWGMEGGEGRPRPCPQPVRGIELRGEEEGVSSSLVQIKRIQYCNSDSSRPASFAFVADLRAKPTSSY